MHKLWIISVLFSSYAYAAIPSMAIPNIVTVSTSKSQTIKKNLSGFTADVRGAIIASGRFKVVKMPKQDNMWQNGNVATVLKALPIINTESADLAVESPVAKSEPDFILLGKVVSISENTDQNPIKDTDKISNVYNVDIAVDYKLVKTSDRSIMASFTAYGHASDVKILTNGSNSQILHHNKPLLIKTASKDLAHDVLDNLNQQFERSSENYNNGSRVVTDVKVYSN